MPDKEKGHSRHHGTTITGDQLTPEIKRKFVDVITKIMSQDGRSASGERMNDEIEQSIDPYEQRFDDPRG